MSFQPEVNQQLIIDGVAYGIAEHPAARGMPYGQEGRAAVVYQIKSPAEARALKVFKPRHRVPGLVGVARRQAQFAKLPGLQVCSRMVLTPQQHQDLLRQLPDLTYGVLMPWVDGPTWMEVMLEGKELSNQDSVALAHSLAGALASMEQEGIAHCDLSGPNLLLPGLAAHNPKSRVELVDVEQIYGPDLSRPDLIPAGSSGYAHKTAPEGLWSAEADRFAGAVLLAEMLGWCDERVRDAAWGEGYFDPEEMQQQTERYAILHAALTDHWGDGVARLFERAWTSETLAQCPTFGDWLVRLPYDEPVAASPAANTSTSTGDSLAAEMELIEASLRSFMQKAEQLESQGDIAGALAAYRKSQDLAPEGSGLWQELELICQQLERALRARERLVASQAAPGVSATATGAVLADGGGRRRDDGPAYLPGEHAASASSAAAPVAATADSASTLAGKAPRADSGPSSSQSVGYADTMSGSYAQVPAAEQAAARMKVKTDVAPMPSTPTPAPPAPVQPRGDSGAKWAKIIVPTVLVLALSLAASIALPRLLAGSASSGGEPSAATASPTVAGAGATASQVPAAVPTPIGSVGFRDSAAVLDEAIFSAQKLPPPGEGKEYQAWLLGADGERRQRMGVVKFGDDGSAQLSYVDRNGINLLKRFDSFEITLEPSPDANPDASHEVVFSGSLPPAAMVHVGHLLIASEDTPNNISSTAGILQAAKLLSDLAVEMAAGQRDNDLARVKRAAEGMVNLIEGQEGEHFGDLDGDGFPNSPEDKFGILLNGTNGYVHDVIHHAELSAKLEDANANIRDHGGHVIVSARNASDFAVQVRDAALRLVTATSMSAAQADIKLAQTLAEQVLNGKDVNGDEKIDHVPGEGAVKTLYQHAQYMADIPVFAGATPPAPGSGGDSPSQHTEGGSPHTTSTP